jgi:preprotein translocase subunit SecB
MAETNPAGNGASQGAQLSVHKLYVKDASFEAPGAPAIFQDQATADPAEPEPEGRELRRGM